MKTPTFMYRLAKDGSVDAQIFDSENIPADWVDSPAKLKNASPPKSELPEVTTGRIDEVIDDKINLDVSPRKRGRPAKAK